MINGQDDITSQYHIIGTGCWPLHPCTDRQTKRTRNLKRNHTQFPTYIHFDSSSSAQAVTFLLVVDIQIIPTTDFSIAARDTHHSRQAPYMKRTGLLPTCKAMATTYQVFVSPNTAVQSSCDRVCIFKQMIIKHWAPRAESRRRRHYYHHNILIVIESDLSQPPYLTCRKIPTTICRYVR